MCALRNYYYGNIAYIVSRVLTLFNVGMYLNSICTIVTLVNIVKQKPFAHTRARKPASLLMRLHFVKCGEFSMRLYRVRCVLLLLTTIRKASCNYLRTYFIRLMNLMESYSTAVAAAQNNTIKSK